MQKGTVIASLSKTDLKNQLKQAQFRLEKARLDLEDVLIGQGYDLSDTTSIPDKLFKTTKLVSGYTSALMIMRIMHIKQIKPGILYSLKSDVLYLNQ